MRKKLNVEHRIISALLLFSLMLIALSYFIGLQLFIYFNDIESISIADSFSIFFLAPYKSELILCWVGAFITCCTLIISVFFSHAFRENSHGNAHFANLFELLRARFFNRCDESIVIGKKYNLPLYSNGFEHVLCFAPTGSGKTTSIAIPNLRLFPYSVVANDVKLTLYEKTAKYREEQLGHSCYLWAPGKRDGKTHCFNPLDLITADKNLRMTDIQRIAHILIPDPKSGDPIWSRASRKLFKALVLYLLDEKGGATLSEINTLIKQESFNEWLYDVLNETEHLDKAFYENGYSYINNHEKTRDSILETFSGYFELFDDPLVNRATSKSDFDIRLLRKKKMTIYIGFSDDDMERLAPIIKLFWQQLISAMIQEVPNTNDEPYPLLCLIDEFSSLGRIERLRRSLKLLREYRVRCVLMMQYLGQTMEQYNEYESRAFLNIKTKISFGTDDIKDAELLSKLLGNKTVKVRGGSVSEGRHSTNFNYQSRPLLSPTKIAGLKKSDSLIIKTGSYPVRAKRSWYLP